MEQSISENLLKLGSFCKFIFRVCEKNNFKFSNIYYIYFFKGTNGKWFTLNQKKKKISLICLGNGFWDLFDEIFNKKEQVYLAKDVFSEKGNKSKEIVKELFQSLKKICFTLGPDISDFYHENTIRYRA